MRHLPKYIMMMAALALCTSCLDEHPRDQLSEDRVFTDAGNLYLNTVATLYNYIGGHDDSQGLQGTSRGVYDMNTFSSDEAMLPTRGADWYDGGQWQQLYLHTWDAGFSISDDTWKYLYKVIVLCNQSLERLDTYKHLLDDSQYNNLTAEVRALRAMFYVYLLDLYGRVPYITSTDITGQMRQLERSQLFYTLYDELRKQLPYLAYERSNVKGEYYGRMTQPVAFFVLAKMALNAEVWTDDVWTDDIRPDGTQIMLSITDDAKVNAWEACLYWCQKVHDVGYTLEEDEFSNFAVHNTRSVENIFTIPMDKSLYTNIFKNLFRSRHNNHAGAMGMASENGTCATIKAVKTHGYGTDDIDPRYWGNYYSGEVYVNNQEVLLDDGTPLVYEPLGVQLDLTGTPYEKTGGARMKKYEEDLTALNDGQLQDNDIVLFRLGDVVLMQAEAMVRLGMDGSYYFNQIRNRAHATPRECTLENILDERLIELAWEGWRRQDLIRFDLFHRPYDQRPQAPGEADRHTIVFPIPGSALSLDEGNRQNPGY